jgi:hypothetical protein
MKRTHKKEKEVPVMWHKENLWNFNILQREHLSNLVLNGGVKL